MFFIFLCVKHFLYLPSYSAPPSKDPSLRGFCKGWWCDYSKEENSDSNQLKQILLNYKNGTLSSIHKNISALQSKGYLPAFCVSGFFYLLGLSDFKQNLTKSHLLLKKGADSCFACSEILSFHPLTEHNSYHLKKANEQGSILAKLILVDNELKKEFPDYDHILQDVYHLGTIATLSWMTRHRSGLKFANLVRKLGTDKAHQNQYWQEMFNLAESGNAAASLWIVEAVISNRTHIVSSKQAIEAIYSHIKSGPWKYDHSGIAFAKHSFNKTTAFELFAKSGDEVSSAFLSYPNLYM